MRLIYNSDSRVVAGWLPELPKLLSIMLKYESECISQRKKMTNYFQIASMDELDGYNPADAEGFIKVNALRLKQHADRK